MSHYTVVKTQIKNREYLIRALVACGFKRTAIEVSQESLPLRGYSGDTRSQRAHIRIKGAGWGRENAVGPSSNDLGWELQADGTYTFHVSEFDRTKYNQQWQDKLGLEYGRAAVRDVASQYDFYVEEDREVNQEIHITCIKY